MRCFKTEPAAGTSGITSLAVMSAPARYIFAFVACLPVAITASHLGVQANVDTAAIIRQIDVSDLAPYDFLILPENDRPYIAAELVRRCTFTIRQMPAPDDS